MKPSVGVLVCVLAVSLVSTAVAQTPDPLIGKWRFNAAKSKFSPGPAPKGGAVTYAMSGNCLTAVNDSVEAVGPALKVQFACLNADGKEYPISGSPDYDTNVYKRIDAYTAGYTRRRDGKVVETGTRVLSKDGKTLTFTAQGTNAKGQKINNVSVYERQ